VRKIPIVQLGLGGVGQALVRQVVASRERHVKELSMHLEYAALTDRGGLVFDPKGIPDDKLMQLVDAKTRGAKLQELEEGRPWANDPALLDEIDASVAIVVDVTASDETIPLLLRAHERGWGIVLANKLPLAGPYDVFKALVASRKTRFETTVAAALPVISTLQAFLLDTGDRVKKIRGCVSGTLNIICQRLERGEKLSQIVADARTHGHTEPDPREDLAGRDAARKALIVARLLGYPLELRDVKVEPLYPAEWDSLSVEEFMEHLPELDARYRQLAQDARAQGQTLRYVIEVSQGRCRARLERLGPDDELLRPGVADSVVAFYTERYGDSALIVRGKGSGPELTASGVLADVLLVAQMLNAPG
jgi:homoserine dehydrogenase